MVAMNVWPTDAADGSVSSEARWRKMARLWVPTGVAAGQGGDMAPTLAYPNLTVKAGACWVDGHYCELPGDQVLAVTPNGLTVVRLDPAANTAQLLYLDGVTVPAQSPTGIYELPIAKITGSALIDQRSVVTPGGSRLVGNTAITLNQPGIGNTVVDLTGFTITYTVVTGRSYRVDFLLQVAQGAAGNGSPTIRLYDNGGLLGVVGQSNLVAANQLTTFSGSIVLANQPAGTHTVKLTGTQNGGADMQINNAALTGRFSVTDIGPTN